MAINKKLIHFEKRENFDTRLANNEINDTSIVFIQDTGELWTHGQFFCTTATNLLEAPSLLTVGDTIAVQIGDKTSNYIVPPAAQKGRTMYECITATTDTRGHWTGTIPGVTELYDGLVIHVRFTTTYYGNGEGYNTLNINNLGHKLVWWRYGSILTTHWGSNAELTLTYRTTAGSYKVANAKGELTNGTTYTDGWVADYAYYTDGNYLVGSYYFRSKINANGYIGRYMLFMRCPDGTVTGLTTTNNSTATTKTMYSGPLLLGQVWYYGSTSTFAANANFYHDGSNIRDNYSLVDVRYTFNCGSTLVSYKPFFIVGSIGNDGYFYLDTTQPWSQEYPDTDNDKIYILLGYAYDTYRIAFEVHKPMYIYKNGGVQLYSQYASETEWANIIGKPSTFTPSIHTHAYTDLTGSTTTADQAIVSNGTANGWTLKTLGSRAFDSTAYLSLAGGTMDSDATITVRKLGSYRKLILSGNSITADVTQTPNGFAGSFLTVKTIGSDEETHSLTVLGMYGSNGSGDTGLSYIYFGGTYSDPLIKITPEGDITSTQDITAAKFIKNGGTSTQFLKADGSVDSNTYSTTSHTHAWDSLTRSSTTANQVIVSTSTANGWELKTLGSNAFNSTGYLPLTGGTLSGNLAFSHGNSSTDQFITWASGTHYQRLKVRDGQTDVFVFQYSTDSGATWQDYFTIRNGSALIGTNTVLNSSNYTTYTVKKDGTGATGTWGIGITGNAGTATEFASNQSVTLTGDTTGTASSKAGWSITTTTKYLTGTSSANYELATTAMTTAMGNGKVTYYYKLTNNTTGLFAATSNANSIFAFNKHDGSYDSQLGFSSNGNIYYRNFANVAPNTTQAWKQIAFTDSNITGQASYAANVGSAGTLGTNYVEASKVIAACNWYDTVTGSDTDSVINRWDEIVNFVAGFEETPDLATYLSNNYLAKTGNSTASPMTGTIYFKDVNPLVLQSTNQDLDIWRVTGNTTGSLWDNTFGFYLRYNGTGSGNDNTLSLWANNQTSSDVEVYRIKQNGILNFLKAPTINGTAISLSGHTHDERYVKLSATEQTIESTISGYAKGIVEFYRSSGDHIAFIQFANKVNNAKRVLGSIGFYSGGIGKLQYRSPSAEFYDILHGGNVSTYVQGSTITLSTTAQTFLTVKTGQSGSLSSTTTTIKLPETDPYTSARTPTSHNHYATRFNDSRNDVMTPTIAAAVNGVAIDFKTNANGVSAGTGSFCGLVTFDPYSDVTGGYPLQMGFNSGLDANNTNQLYIRTVKDADTWNSWRTVITSANIGNYASSTSHDHDSTYLKLAGGTMTGAITASTASQANDFAKGLNFGEDAHIGYSTGLGIYSKGEIWIRPAQSSLPTVTLSKGLKISGTEFTYNNTNVSLEGHTHADYVTSVGVTDDNTNHANQLRYVKDGISTYFTVPFATSATTATTASNARQLLSISNNEVCIGATATPAEATNAGVWINYRSGYGGTTSDDATQITAYFFGNRKGDTTGVTLYATTFNGNATSATKANNLNKSTLGYLYQSATTTTGSTGTVTATSGKIGVPIQFYGSQVNYALANDLFYATVASNAITANTIYLGDDIKSKTFVKTSTHIPTGASSGSSSGTSGETITYTAGNGIKIAGTQISTNTWTGTESQFAELSNPGSYDLIYIIED